MKIATIIYHKNISNIYKEVWIKKFVDSINSQTLDNFTIYELNYGDDDLDLSEKYGFKEEHHYYQLKFDNHAEAINFLFDECLIDDIDVIFNNNLDDYNEPDRFEKQLLKIKQGYDIVGSNFRYIIEENTESHASNLKSTNFNRYDIETELKKDHNILCHPSICYSREFYANNRYNGEEIPYEDLKLWKRTVSKYRFHILKDVLINYRVHSNQITKKNEVKIKEKNKGSKVKETETNIITFTKRVVIDNCICGEPRNRIRYNFCQKCNRLY